MLVEKLNFTVNINELREYYTELQSQHDKYYWEASKNLEKINEGAKEAWKSHNNGRDINIAGWALQKWNNGDEIMAPHPNILKGFNDNVSEQKIEDVQHETPMLFGIAKRIIDLFPESSRMALSVVTPGTHLKRHTDEIFLLRVHIPIYSEIGNIWTTDDGEYYLEEGSAYLCDTRSPHSITNNSQSDRVHLLFALPESSLEKLRSLNGIF